MNDKSHVGLLGRGNGQRRINRNQEGYLRNESARRSKHTKLFSEAACKPNNITGDSSIQADIRGNDLHSATAKKHCETSAFKVGDSSQVSGKGHRKTSAVSENQKKAGKAHSEITKAERSATACNSQRGRDDEVGKKSDLQKANAVQTAIRGFGERIPSNAITERYPIRSTILADNGQAEGVVKKTQTAWVQFIGYQEIQGKECTITLEPRNWYCDRGNFIAKLHPVGELARDIDEYDLWPRYFFDEERAKLEVEAWLQKRGQIISENVKETQNRS